MNRYKEMYCKLFNKITDIVCQLKILQQEAEEIYLSSEQTEGKTQPEVEVYKNQS